MWGLFQSGHTLGNPRIGWFLANLIYILFFFFFGSVLKVEFLMYS
jgi:hypothetical protein